MASKGEVEVFWYIFICLLMLYPIYVVYLGKIAEKKTQCVALMIASSILWFFMAMRSTSVGVDTKYYSYVFTQFKDIPISKIFTAVTYANESKTWAFDFEPGYRLLNKLVSMFSASPQAITIVNSTLIIVLLYRLIRKSSPNFMLSIWLYITLGIYQTEMNVTRNAIAILIVYNAFSYVKNRQLGKYLGACVFASMFHMAALAFIPVYWLVHYYHITFRRAVMIVTAACLIGMIFPMISPYIKMIVPDSFDKYFEGNNEKLASLMVGILNAGMFGVTYFMLNKTQRKRVFDENRIGLYMLLINLCFFGINIGLGDASRMAALFGPYLIIYIPQMINLVGPKEKREDVTVLIAMLSGILYILRLAINNIGGTMPYEFFW